MNNNLFIKTVFYNCKNKQELFKELKKLKLALNELTSNELTYQNISIINNNYLSQTDFNKYDLQLLYEASQNVDSFNVRPIGEYIYDNYISDHIKLSDKIKLIINKYHLNKNNLFKILNIKSQDKWEQIILQIILDNKTTNNNEITNLVYNYCF